MHVTRLLSAAKIHYYLCEDLRTVNQFLYNCKLVCTMHTVICSRHGAAKSNTIFQAVYISTATCILAAAL